MPSPLSHPTALLRQNLSRFTTHLTHLYHTRKPLLALLVASLLGTLGTLRVTWLDYQQFLSYGPGGVPYNALGWFLTNVLRLFGVNVLDTSGLAQDPDKRTWLGEGWPEKRRRGARPKVGPHPIPQRQLDQHTTGEMKEKFIQAFTTLAHQNPTLVQLQPSVYEMHTEAMFIHDDVPSTLGPEMAREISHIHATGDHSAHVVLSPTDAKKVIDSGWGQLHPLAGRQFVKRLRGKYLPKEYVLLYAPRGEEELGTLMGVVKASVGFMTGSRDVK